ncbi:MULTISPECIES: hypothetical protein [Mycolicibacterium]|uniref:Transmembrane protein n=1 Tax=Mycolicibacterium vanbaalenii (strain DSM 7251 / JCM 13017 / BCRC 16820 / KCTC 9966 / NRRL B-24157 / PYR-1) TaxID=350058 RepID=A1T3D6_MYCVP|nr:MULTISPECIES: hypothetical protein [Mycolicibacterium]ABM11686.1 conserved hypothetical protein [Mycolicibacterium vanbaalenii PYR-1]MCV7126243.1 hypothetical protein [Mycolicibacterium vanbaalenii PYR-1]MDW5614179.1 hypothetical protein [Mycolicibacterium sp. D5.8-2]UJL29407.1 hypothetical protein HZU38_02405 [Mycolicibacterium vanbaalenii]WND57565.1 hypothetical protein QQA43_03865 [Mycolicibacterium vanbaalenii]
MTDSPDQPGRPDDVDTAFWLWVAALPLLAIGYVVDLLTARAHPTGLILALSLVFVGILVAVVLTFLFLMRQGYRWARTLLTGGAIATVVYSISNLFTVERPDAAAMGYAAPVIIGSVLIAGGVYLLHRKDSHEFFMR